MITQVCGFFFVSCFGIFWVYKGGLVGQAYFRPRSIYLFNPHTDRLNHISDQIRSQSEAQREAVNHIYRHSCSRVEIAKNTPGIKISGIGSGSEIPGRVGSGIGPYLRND